MTYAYIYVILYLKGGFYMKIVIPTVLALILFLTIIPIIDNQVQHTAPQDPEFSITFNLVQDPIEGTLSTDTDYLAFVLFYQKLMAVSPYDHTIQLTTSYYDEFTPYNFSRNLTTNVNSITFIDTNIDAFMLLIRFDFTNETISEILWNSGDHHLQEFPDNVTITVNRNF